MAYDPTARLREPRLLTPAETAQILAVSPSTLARWRKSGEGPAWVRIGSKPRYTPAAVHRYIAQRSVAS